MRRPGWQQRLSEYLIATEKRYIEEGFAFGKLDCVHFVSNWVLECTGEDPLADYRGKYSTEEEAFALLKAEGSFYHALRRRFGNPVHPSRAQRGDIAYVKEIKALGIFFTAGAKTQALLLGEGGFSLYPAKQVSHAFRVGRE